MRELRVKCLDCGCEDITVHWTPGATRLGITCDGCGAGSNPPEESAERDIQQNGLHESLHAPAPKGKVYFIAPEGEEAPVKIGYTTTTVQSRIGVLQTGHPYKLRPIAEIEGSYQLESALHKIFAQHRLHGEWFKRSPELDALMNALGNLESPRDEPQNVVSPPEG